MYRNFLSQVLFVNENLSAVHKIFLYAVIHFSKFGTPCIQILYVISRKLFTLTLDVKCLLFCKLIKYLKFELMCTAHRLNL